MATSLKNDEERLRKLYWPNLIGMEQFRLFMGGYEPSRKEYLSLTKKSLYIIVGILTGHYRLNYHLVSGFHDVILENIGIQNNLNTIF